MRIIEQYLIYIFTIATNNCYNKITKQLFIESTILELADTCVTSIELHCMISHI